MIEPRMKPSLVIMAFTLGIWRGTDGALPHQDDHDSLRLYDHRHARQLGVNATASPHRYPIVEEDFQWAPHCNPSDDKQTFIENFQNGSFTDGAQQASQQHTGKEE